MPAADAKSFNNVFISYAHEDKTFADAFKHKLEEKLGRNIEVWIDERLEEGQNWRRKIESKLNRAALVVVILSPDSIKSPWVHYEWEYSLVMQQSEPFFVYYRRCNSKNLKRFMDYQLGTVALANTKNEANAVLTSKESEIDEILEKIARKIDQISELRQHYEKLTDENATDIEQQEAASELGNASESLKLAAANYLIAALEFWLSNPKLYGPVVASIASELGRLRKRKAIPSLVRLFLAQSDPPYDLVLQPVQYALSLLSCDDPLG